MEMVKGITLEQVEADIKSGKCKSIFLCSFTLWWTHDEADLEDATHRGRIFRAESDARMLADPNVPEEAKARLRALKAGHDKLVKDNPEAFPTDQGLPVSPIGAPLLQNNDPVKFIKQTKLFASHGAFGKHGLKTFIKTHHRNCTDHFYNKWDKYNDLIDKENGNS